MNQHGQGGAIPPNDDLNKKMAKVKKAKTRADKKGVPAGAQGGASATGDVREATAGIRAVFRKDPPGPAGQGSTRG